MRPLHIVSLLAGFIWITFWFTGYHVDARSGAQFKGWDSVIIVTFLPPMILWWVTGVIKFFRNKILSKD